MTEQKFIDLNIENWKELEKMNDSVKVASVSNMSKDELKTFVSLYRTAGLNLSYARTHFPKSKITSYLNQITGISHNLFYTKETTSATDAKKYFTDIFPSAVRANALYFWISFAVFFAGLAFCFALATYDAQFISFFIPKSQQSLIDFSTSTRDLDYATFSAVIMTNNIRVSFLSFAWGFLGGIGTIYVMFTNGLSIGAFIGLVAQNPQDFENFFALILPHGVLELCAIFISGAAGLLIGKNFLIPKHLSRKDGLVKGAKEGAVLIPGVCVMLVIAGLIEGFLTPAPVSNFVKFSVAFVSLVLIVVYFMFAGKSKIPKS